jgi:transporter family-2 protein
MVLVIVLGLAGGIAVGVQGPLGSMIAQRLGILESVFIVHIGGATAALLPLLIYGGGNLADWRSVPWYALAAGVLGIIVVGSLSYVIPHVGAAASTTIFVAGQLFVGAFLDHYGLLGAAVRPFDLQRAIGLLIVFVGVWLTVR